MNYNSSPTDLLNLKASECQMLNQGVCCTSGFRFQSVPNVTLKQNETLKVFRDKEFVGYFTVLNNTCSGQGWLSKY